MRCGHKRKREELEAYHSSCFPGFDEVPSDVLDFFQITPHFVVEEGKPVCDPENEYEPSVDQLVHVDGSQNSLQFIYA